MSPPQFFALLCLACAGACIGLMFWVRRRRREHNQYDERWGGMH